MHKSPYHLSSYHQKPMDALLKVLNESPVLSGIATEVLEHIVGLIVDTITFIEVVLTPEGIEHVKLLHITVKCCGMIL